VSGGNVVDVRWQKSSDHAAGYGFRTLIKTGPKSVEYFGHQDPAMAAVKAGDVVEPGQLIGQVGNPTNGLSTAPHLHFDRRVDGAFQPVDFSVENSPVLPEATLRHGFDEVRAGTPLGIHAGYDFSY
jgi:murein DD-endopeptidase MepM/ murein hydrolase activator NlpD